MGFKIFMIVTAIICMIVILSFLAPVHSQKKFWVVICKTRAVMDLICYWFFNLCAIAAIICAAVLLINSAFRYCGLTFY